MTQPSIQPAPLTRRSLLSEPINLFLIALVMVAIGASVGSAGSVRFLNARGEERGINSLLAPDGLWWWISHCVQNFTQFPALGVVVVSVLGIGLAERSGLIGSALRLGLRQVPSRWLAPLVSVVAINSSLAVDAGYVIVPPLAAALFAAAGRSPVAGLALAYAGVAGGYAANLLLTGIDPLLAGLTTAAAQLVEPDYHVAATCNWWFMAASSVLLMALSLPALAWVEARLPQRSNEARETVAPVVPATEATQSQELVGLRAAGIATGLLFLLVCWAQSPGGSLAGNGLRDARWIEASVPLIALGFSVPALVYGWVTGTLPNAAAVYRAQEAALKDLAPYLLTTFVAAQFIACFAYTGLGEYFATGLSNQLATLALPLPILLWVTMLAVMALDLSIASASAKYALLAPILVPAFMGIGVSPELTQAAYRVGDSITNVVSPLNPYLVVILAQLRRFESDAGWPRLVQLMLPFLALFALCWPLFLLAWTSLGLPLGPGGPLRFSVDVP